jgi:hypothetical protein
MSGLELNLPDITTARTANVRVVTPLSWYDSIFSHIKSNLGSKIGGTVQQALNLLLQNGVPIAAKLMINSMSFQLGNSQLPVDTTFEKSCGWAIALIVILAIVCALMVVLVGLCIWWERRLEDRKKLVARKEAEEWGEGGANEAHIYSHARGSRSTAYDDDDDDDASTSFASGSYSSSESDDEDDEGGSNDGGELAR